MHGAIPPIPNTPSWRGAQLKHSHDEEEEEEECVCVCVCVCVCLSTSFGIVPHPIQSGHLFLTELNNNDITHYQESQHSIFALRTRGSTITALCH
jgi:hypothetical protein